MKIALFDLDDTLLDGDSEYQWGLQLIAVGAVDHDHYHRAMRRFDALYESGQLDLREFGRFVMAPMANNHLSLLLDWRRQFIEQRIKRIALPLAQHTINAHKQQQHTTVIITATNRFVTEPIAKLFKVDHLIATEPAMHEGQFIGEIAGTPCFREGKVCLLQQWLSQQDAQLEESWAYSDSSNDIPLLEYVDHPIAVHPDPILEAHATQNNWHIVSFKG